MAKILPFIICCFLYIGCELDMSVPAEKPTLTGTDWQLQFFAEDGKMLLPAGDQLYEILFETDSTYSGSNDCNTFIGEYKTGADQSIEFISFATTKIYCGDSSWDARFNRAIQSARYYAIKGCNLVLKDDRNVLLVFRKQE